MKQRFAIAGLVGLVIFAITAGFLLLGEQQQSAAQDGDDAEFTYAGEVDAPDFPDNLSWLNVSEPLTMDELEGKIVLLDFWTYGCINCIHIIPDLERLEEEFADSLVVIGVHSAKFDNEGVTSNIRNIVQRYGVVHPVVNDVDFRVWRTYGARAWPTLVLIDPLGRVVGGHAGEGVYPLFQPILEVMDEEYKAAGLIDTEPLAKWEPEVFAREITALNYPGKVLADTEGNRLVIADSSNHRLIVTGLENFDSPIIIGSGERGYTDGSFEEAQFNMPHGFAIDGDILYVADTVNHAIREINLAEGTVSTLVGTGQQARTYPPSAGTAPDVDLSSPWDLELVDDILYIAMAGPHQLWKIDLATGDIEPHAGNAREDLIDGPLGDAQLAQPSGIASDGEVLYFADSEASAIRSADIDPSGEVRTLVGTGLFDFGDEDGVGDEVLLQHPLGVAVGPDGLLYIADTYNNKIKLIDPATRETTTFAGTGERGLVDGALSEAQFYEPGGIFYADGLLYVADTNNHAIRIIDLENETVSTISFADETVLLPESVDEGPGGGLSPVNPDTEFTVLDDRVLELPAQTVAAGQGELVLDVQLPEGYKLNELAPFTAITATNDVLFLQEKFQNYQELVPDLPVRFPVMFTEGSGTVHTDLTIYWCEAVNETLCFVETVSLEVPITVGEGENTELVLPYELVPPIVN